MALNRLATRQLGVVSQTQLYELGFAHEQVRRMVRHGWLLAIHHNVYAVGHRGLVPMAYLLAAQLSLGPRCFLSHRTAAAVYGLRAVNRHEIELTVTGGGRRRRPGLRIHRTVAEPHPRDVRMSGLFRVSSVMRLLCESAPRESEAELERLITLAVQKQLLRPQANDGRRDMEEALARHAGYRGMGKLARVLHAYRRVKDSKSGLERDFDALLAEHPEIPDPERNIHIDGWEIDRFWPEQRLAVELDGRPYHMAVRDMEKDRRKDAALQRLRLIPLRFTDHRINTDQAGILGDLHHFLGL